MGCLTRIYSTAARRQSRKNFIPIGRCRYCKKYWPIRITTMVHPKTKRKFHILSCPSCDLVLNATAMPRLRWIAEADLIRAGWIKMKPRTNPKRKEK